MSGKILSYIICAIVLSSLKVNAQQNAPSAPDLYNKQEVMIPMRDGVKLFTIIYTPKATQEKLPFLLMRTPYGIRKYQSPEKREHVKDMAQEGYIFVYQDIRGRYQSEGKYEMLRVTRDKSNPLAIDESTDAYDTIEWLINNVPNNNRRAGMYGISYGGWTTIIAASDPHPALKAVSEQATPADMYIGDDFHHNGAFRLGYAFEYAYQQENSKTDEYFPFKEYDTYNWFLKLGPLSNVNSKYFHNRIPSWNNYVNHPDYDDFWKKQSLASRLDYPRVPVQHVAGWWDQEDFYGPLKAYEILEKKDTDNKNYIVIGPWNHGGWARGDGSSLGNIRFYNPTAETFRQEIQAKWFAWYLKDKGNGSFPEAIVFQTGNNQWKKYDTWPPRHSIQKKIYMQDNGKLSFVQPQHKNQAFDSYLSDPENPVPYRQRPIEQTYGAGSRWREWLVEDQCFVHKRPDVLSWETDTLTEDITISGEIMANIYGSTTGSDADWIVKLIDVYPGIYPKDMKMSGYQLMVANDILRGRYRTDFSVPQPIQPDSVTFFPVNLHAADHVFKKGHKIMIQIQSTWFPLIDINPQTYVGNIFKAESKDYKKQEHKIFRSARYPSNIQLPLVE